jgi:hypothetical protein
VIAVPRGLPLSDGRSSAMRDHAVSVSPPPHLVPADAADEIDIAVHFVIHLPPQRQNVDAARHHFAEMRRGRRRRIDMEPLRVVLAREIDDRLDRDFARGGYPFLAHRQILETSRWPHSPLPMLSCRAGSCCRQPGEGTSR